MVQALTARIEQLEQRLNRESTRVHAGRALVRDFRPSS
jgi:capsule polysaccharide export protein KpsE/RkpR